MAQEEINTKAKTKSKPVSETRKIRKPLMERKRRERINASLGELARLLTEAKKVKHEKGKSTKLEKADILELTVKHLQTINNNGCSSESGKSIDNESVAKKYEEGFKECIRAVERVLNKSTSDELRERLLTHLHSRLKVLNRVSNRKEEKQEEKENRLLQSEQPFVCSKELKPDLSNKYTLTLVPTKLPDGGMAFVLSGNAQTLLKEWNILSTARLEEREGKTYTENANNDSHVISAEENIVNYSLDENDQEIKMEEYQNIFSVSNVNPLSSSTSHCDNTDNTDQKIFHTLQPLEPQIYYTSTCSQPSSSKVQNKTHCPPTPPPSPLTAHVQKHPQMRPLQPVAIRQEDIEYNNMNQPFDLTISRMWRPW